MEITKIKMVTGDNGEKYIQVGLSDSENSEHFAMLTQIGPFDLETATEKASQIYLTMVELKGGTDKVSLEI